MPGAVAFEPHVAFILLTNTVYDADGCWGGAGAQITNHRPNVTGVADG